jgi:hypothetical protein
MALDGADAVPAETKTKAPIEVSEPPDHETMIVPKSVRSDELMPAAVGGANRRRKKASSSAPRRKGRPRRAD